VGLRLLMQHDLHETDRRVEWHGPYGVRGLVDQLRERMLGEGGEIKRVEGMIGAVQGGASSGLSTRFTPSSRTSTSRCWPTSPR